MAAMAYVLINSRSEQEVAKKLMNYEIVTEVHELYGEWDIVIKVEANEMADLQDFINNIVRADKDIMGTETLIVSDVF